MDYEVKFEILPLVFYILKQKYKYQNQKISRYQKEEITYLTSILIEHDVLST